MKANLQNIFPAIVGPTGVGKTSAAIELAKDFDAALVSVDSRQIYKDMDIATGKEVDRGEWQQDRGRMVLVIDQVPIYGLNIITPDRLYSVSDWYDYTIALLNELAEEQKKIILVGGTGFYLKALQGGIATLDIPPNEDLRAELQDTSVAELANRLSRLDPGASEKIDMNNKRRVIRAIEVALYQGSQRFLDRPTFTLHQYGLTMERERLYQKIDQRIDDMIDQGLVQEVQDLLKKYNRNLPAMTGIGYAEIMDYLEGKSDLATSVQKIKWRNHQYVRRQYTWFKKQEVEWFRVDTDASWKNKLQHRVMQDLSNCFG